MKPQQTSKQSSSRSYKTRTLAERFGYIIPDAPVWKDWRNGEIHTITFEGYTFKAVKTPGEIVMGPGLQESTWGFSGVVLRMRVDPCNYNDSNSCAFARVFPHGQDREKLKMWAWWLYNVPLQRGVVSYLIPADGDPVEIRKVMAKRGFRTVAVSPSRMANYNAWLLVHPSDPILRQTRTKKVDFDDELLGIAIASCDGIRNARSTDGRSKQARLVSNPVPVNERTA